MDDPVLKLESLYALHGPAILRYLRGMLRSPEAAEDLLHETFVQALRHMDRLARASSPKAWLFVIARNLGISSIRRRRTALALTADHAAPAEEPEDPRQETLRRALADLSPLHREPLELRLRDGLSYEEIAHVLGLPLGTVRSRLHNAVKQLRKTLAEEVCDGT